MPLLDDLLVLQERVRWEQRSETLLGGKGLKIKKLEQLLIEGEARGHSEDLMERLREVMAEAERLQALVSDTLDLCAEKRGRVMGEELLELMEACEGLQVTIPAKHALARKLGELEGWVEKARARLGGTREQAKLNELKQLLEEWGEMRVSVKEEQQLRSLVFPTQGFIERMKKCARKYEKQQAAPRSPDGPPMALAGLLAYEKRVCPYEECTTLMQEAPEIVKQDQEYQALRDLIQQAVEWERKALLLFESQASGEMLREHLVGYRRVPAKRSVVSHVMRLYLVQEWKAKVLKHAGCAPSHILEGLL